MQRAACGRSPSANRRHRGRQQQRWRRGRTSSTWTRPSERVLSLVPPRYPDLWTGAKGFYKVEPVVADGGEVVLYAPHIREIAAMHPALVDIGYHCRDYFLAHWERYRRYPRGEIAHSTHLFGAGTYDPVHGEHQRVRVTLATGIPEDVVGGHTSATWRHRRSTPKPGRRTPTRWSCATPARCSTDSARSLDPRREGHSPGYTTPTWARMASSVPARASDSSNGMIRLSIEPSARQRWTSSISNWRPFPSYEPSIRSRPPHSSSRSGSSGSA